MFLRDFLGDDTKTALPFLGAHFTINFARSIIIVFLPLYLIFELGLDRDEAAVTTGFIVFAMYSTSILSRIPSAIKVDQSAKRRRIVAFSLLTSSAVYIIIGLTDSILLIAILLCIFQAIVALEFLTVRSFMGLLSQVSLGRLQTKVTSSGVGGFMSGALVGGFVFQVFQPRFILLPPIILLLAVGLTFPLVTRGKNIEQIEEHYSNTKNNELSSKTRLKVLLNKEFRPVFFLFILEGLAAGMTVPLLSLYAYDVINISTGEIGLLIALGMGISAIFGPLIGKSLDVHGTKPFIILGLGIMGLGLLIEGAATNMAMLAFGILFVYIGVVWFIDSSITNVLKKAKKEVLAIVHSGTGTGWNLGLIIGGPIGAFLFVTAPRLPFFVGALIILFAIFSSKIFVKSELEKVAIQGSGA